MLVDNTTGTLWVDDVMIEELNELFANAQGLLQGLLAEVLVPLLLVQATNAALIASEVGWSFRRPMPECANRGALALFE